MPTAISRALRLIVAAATCAALGAGPALAQTSGYETPPVVESATTAGGTPPGPTTAPTPADGTGDTPVGPLDAARERGSGSGSDPEPKPAPEVAAMGDDDRASVAGETTAGTIDDPTTAPGPSSGDGAGAVAGVAGSSGSASGSGPAAGPSELAFTGGAPLLVGGAGVALMLTAGGMWHRRRACAR